MDRGLVVAASPHRPAKWSTGDLFRDVGELASWAGKPAVFASLSFAAYLIGIISIAMTKALGGAVAKPYWVWYVGHRLRLPGFKIKTRILERLEVAVINRMAVLFVEDGEFQHRTIERARKLRLAEKSALTWRLHTNPQLEEDAIRDEDARKDLLKTVVNYHAPALAVSAELPYMRYRLIGAEDQLYGEYDRLHSEGEFRVGLVLPILLIVVTLAINLNNWWLLGLLVPMFLLYLGRASYSEADYGLASAIAAGRLQSPVLDNLSAKDIAWAEGRAGIDRTG